MTLEEAIKHCEEVAEKQEITAKSNLMETDKIKADGILRLYDADEYESCMKCAEEHRQLAEWLRELKAYKNSPVLQRWLKQCDTCKYQHKKASEPPCRRCCHTYSNKHEEVNADENSN